VRYRHQTRGTKTNASRRASSSQHAQSSNWKGSPVGKGFLPSASLRAATADVTMTLKRQSCSKRRAGVAGSPRPITAAPPGPPARSPSP
jgi:hypothetical protein